ncbi:MAG: radical SAM protein [Oscillospiraceae bacterium]|nr:radical SAM protein [Oscillospiraceae bacterium]
MSVDFTALEKLHPCFSLGRKSNNGRIHLPVSPNCNIFCKFCSRSVNGGENRPGVTANIITPEEALGVTRRALELAPEITVVGVAGPGDALATPYAVETFRLIGAEFPRLIKCMSTNGLLLPEKIGELVQVGINALTVTVNAVSPEILSRLCSGIIYRGKKYGGEHGAKILIENQLEGIRLAAGAGVTVKVNTVLVPDINGEHIGVTAKAVKNAGAKLYNIIPLIPCHELKNFPVPTCSQIESARGAAEEHIKVFRCCQHCRADAIGVPGGEDYGERVYLSKITASNTFSHG